MVEKDALLSLYTHTTRESFVSERKAQYGGGREGKREKLCPLLLQTHIARNFLPLSLSLLHSRPNF